MLTLADVIEALTHSRPEMTPVVITEAAIDSRQTIPGSLFVAIPGERTDGHNYIGQAFKRGSVAAFIEHPVEGDFPVLDLRNGEPAGGWGKIETPVCLMVNNTVSALQQAATFWRQKLTRLRVIGITGSVGKSTTKEAIAQVLSQRYKVLKSAANLNNEIGLPLNVLKLTSGHEYAVLEMGFYVIGEIAQLCDIARPQIGVLNNIGTVHAERAGSQAVIAQGKGELVEALPEDGMAILNYDDPWIRPMKSRTRARVFYYGLDPAADLWADGIESMGLDGIRFKLHYKNEVLHLHVPMLGRHSVETAVRAAAVGLVEGMSWDQIIHGLQESQAQLRLVAVRSEKGALILDDSYNAAPESTLAALNLLSELKGRRIAVLGDMLELGPYERDGHEKVGVRAAEVADILITLGPRAHTIAYAARKSGMKPSSIFEHEEIQPIIDWMHKNLTEYDAVLIKGSHGLRMDRIVSALEVA